MRVMPIHSLSTMTILLPPIHRAYLHPKLTSQALKALLFTGQPAEQAVRLTAIRRSKATSTRSVAAVPGTALTIPGTRMHDVIDANTGYYTLDDNYDCLTTGENTFYFRAWDNAGNVSSTSISSIFKYSGDAPTEPRELTVTPSTNTDNSFAFSWQLTVNLFRSAIRTYLLLYSQLCSIGFHL